MTLRRLLLAVALAAAAAGLACGGGSSAPGDAAGPALTVRDDGTGGVTVEATWGTDAHLNASDDLASVAATYTGREVTFVHVRLDTHSVDLSKYDLAALAELETSAGRQAALAFHPLSAEGHHVAGVLAFPGRWKPERARLLVRDVGGVPLRRLEWVTTPAD